MNEQVAAATEIASAVDGVAAELTAILQTRETVTEEVALEVRRRE